MRGKLKEGRKEGRKGKRKEKGRKGGSKEKGNVRYARFLPRILRREGGGVCHILYLYGHVSEFTAPPTARHSAPRPISIVGGREIAAARRGNWAGTPARL